jgi:hypothetical protein
LGWLNSEKKKDLKELEVNKEKIVKELRGLNKDQLFPKPKKFSVWQRIKIMIWGN